MTGAPARLLASATQSKCRLSDKSRPDCWAAIWAGHRASRAIVAPHQCTRRHLPLLRTARRLQVERVLCPAAAAAAAAALHSDPQAGQHGAARPGPQKWRRQYGAGSCGARWRQHSRQRWRRRDGIKAPGDPAAEQLSRRRGRCQGEGAGMRHAGPALFRAMHLSNKRRSLRCLLAAKERHGKLQAARSPRAVEPCTCRHACRPAAPTPAPSLCRPSRRHLPGGARIPCDARAVPLLLHLTAGQQAMVGAKRGQGQGVACSASAPSQGGGRAESLPCRRPTRLAFRMIALVANLPLSTLPLHRLESFSNGAAFALAVEGKSNKQRFLIF